MSDAVSIRYAGDGQPLVSFREDEVTGVVVRTVHGFSLKRLQNRRPFIQHTTLPYRRVDIRVKIANRAVAENLALLTDQTDLLELDIPGAQAGETETIRARLVSSIPAYYCGGYAAADREITLEFTEAE